MGDRSPPPRDRSPARDDEDRRYERGGGDGGGEGGRCKGTACRWNERGFGFIRPEDGGEDLFLHVSQILDGNALREGDPVTYVKVFDEKRGKERAEQINGGVTVDGYGGPGGSGGGGPYGGYDRNQVCFDFLKGRCTRGDSCRYSHDPDAGDGAAAARGDVSRDGTRGCGAIERRRLRRHQRLHRLRRRRARRGLIGCARWGRATHPSLGTDARMG